MNSRTWYVMIVETSGKYYAHAESIPHNQNLASIVCGYNSQPGVKLLTLNACDTKQYALKAAEA